MNGKTSRSMRSHHGLYEVHLPVTDLDRAIDFYVEMLVLATPKIEYNL